MKHIRIYIALAFLTVLLPGCTIDTSIDKFPEDNVTTENCAADGVGCKQFNEDLKR